MKSSSLHLSTAPANTVNTTTCSHHSVSSTSSSCQTSSAVGNNIRKYNNNNNTSFHTHLDRINSNTIAGAGECSRSHSIVGKGAVVPLGSGASAQTGNQLASVYYSNSSYNHHQNYHHKYHSGANQSISSRGETSHSTVTTEANNSHHHHPHHHPNQESSTHSTKQQHMGQKSSKRTLQQQQQHYSSNSEQYPVSSHIQQTQSTHPSSSWHPSSMKSSKKQSEKSSQQGTSTAGANQISSHGGATGGGGVSKDDKHTNPSQNVSNNTSKKQSSSNKGATGASGAGGVSAGTGGGGGSGGHVTSGGGRGVGGGGGTSNRKCEVCCVEIDPDHPDTADHEAHRVQQRPNKQQLFEIDLDRSEAVLGDLSPFIDLSHKLILTQENPSWVHKKYWNWKDCVMEVLDADSILDMVSTRRMERLFYPDHEDTTTQLFWRNLAERVCLISRLRSNPIREYDREEFTQRFLPVSATLAFDCMFAVGKKEVSYRDERNNEYTKWRDFFVIQSLYTLHEVRHFIIDWLPRKVQLEGVKFTPELQLGIREVREERLENFESRSDLVTCVFFVADVDPEAAQSKQGTAESTGGGGGSVTQGATATNSSITAGMSTLPHIVILYNFWIRSYDETRARDVSRTVSCPLFDVFNREVGTNHILRAYQSYLVMTYMNTYSTQGKMILFKINGMSDNNPELLVLDTKQISPTINVAAGWQKIAYKSLLKPTEVSILLLSELKPLTTINLNPLCANHQLKIRYSGDNLTTNIPETIQTYGVSVSASGDEALKSGSKVPLNVLMNKLNQTSTLVVKSPPFSGIQINAKVKTQSELGAEGGQRTSPPPQTGE
ncbi:uncharacterized protein LOC142336930 isoform X2 [Convolutriloba macropyga]|uniref:uncharacterized protein LOC142336930 isoform X2 n=1 Tax=Convolutriloba macropyga TaxID=536237 RepID=UPI003F528B4A